MGLDTCRSLLIHVMSFLVRHGYGGLECGGWSEDRCGTRGEEWAKAYISCSRTIPMVCFLRSSAANAQHTPIKSNKAGEGSIKSASLPIGVERRSSNVRIYSNRCPDASMPYLVLLLRDNSCQNPRSKASSKENFDTCILDSGPRVVSCHISLSTIFPRATKSTSTQGLLPCKLGSSRPGIARRLLNMGKVYDNLNEECLKKVLPFPHTNPGTNL